MYFQTCIRCNQTSCWATICHTKSLQYFSCISFLIELQFLPFSISLNLKAKNVIYVPYGFYKEPLQRCPLSLTICSMDFDAITKSSTSIARRNKYPFFCRVRTHTSSIQLVNPKSLNSESMSFYHTRPACFNPYKVFRSLHTNYSPLVPSI